MKKAMILTAILGAAACQTGGGYHRSSSAADLTDEEMDRLDDEADASRRDQEFAEACEHAVGPVDHESEGDMVVAMRDESTKFRAGAVGVTAGGGLEEAAGFVGTGIVTSRGGATIVEGGSPDVEMRPCIDPYFDEHDY